MNYKEFQNYVINHIMDYLKDYPEYEGCFFQIKEVEKADGIYEGLMLNDNHNPKLKGIIFPIIKLDKFWESYQKNGDIDFITGLIAATFHSGRKDNEYHFITDWDEVKNYIRPVLTSLFHEPSYLENKPHGIVDNLTYYYRVVKDEIEVGITDDMLKFWGIDNIQLHMEALKNISAQSNLIPMREVLKEMLPDLCEEAFEEIAGIENDKDFTVCSFPDKRYGASIILSDAVMTKYLQSHHVTWCYILPSSIHEVLLLDEGENIPDILDLCEWIKDTNDTMVEKPDLLSYHLFKYSLANGLEEVM